MCLFTLAIFVFMLSVITPNEFCLKPLLIFNKENGKLYKTLDEQKVLSVLLPVTLLSCSLLT